ncbi:hypothetical protein SS50377_24805 [Spironucleus salmonicida]|uniref:Uncharacterized protein n=1 Tax=Spironucleus salmonicida TaxID=348837 RepID=V6LK29_9EUKA|nr:hypothetical protein SS50377_24785 [Spironucleus salmonicida]KAH0572684.1 hypothetical protein SS50377_24796 [Spironucleus salmonicida]KAH0572693.1 hypothetical protein SS50377_24805 [Spironucleus salmonicida]|eukprot:EST44123.1 Hypothetical protein SS50377_16081 [Spironucleus salmonicida]
MGACAQDDFVPAAIIQHEYAAYDFAQNSAASLVSERQAQSRAGLSLSMARALVEEEQPDVHAEWDLIE